MFYKKLYASPKLYKNRSKLVRKLKRRKLLPNLYIITLASGNNLLEFYQSFQLRQPYYDNKENMPYIIGIAENYEEATKLVQRILMDSYNKTGSFDVTKFCLGE